MSMGKCLGVAALIYLLLNFILLLVFVAVGGFVVGTDPVSIGAFFSDYVAGDPMGLVAVILIPGGGVSPVETILGSIAVLMSDEEINMGAEIILILWSILPGMIGALVAGGKFSEENSKAAFWGPFLGMFILMLVPMILGLVGQLSPFLPEHELTQYFVDMLYLPVEYEVLGVVTNSYYVMGATELLSLGGIEVAVKWVTENYIVVVLYAFFNSALFAGFGAMVSSEL